MFRVSHRCAVPLLSSSIIITESATIKGSGTRCSKRKNASAVLTGRCDVVSDWVACSAITTVPPHRSSGAPAGRNEWFRGELWCLRCLLLVMCTYPFAKKALTLYLARSEGHERYFGCNLMQCEVLASSHQHLIAEAPERALAILRRSVRSTDFVGLPRTSLVSIRDSSRDYGYTQPERAPGGRAVPGRTLRPQDHTDL